MNKYIYIIIFVVILVSVLLDFIIKNKKNIFIINNVELINNDITTEIINNISNNNKNIIISLTTIPTRFITDDFDLIINNLSNQKLKPKCVYINICKKYNRKFEYDEKIYQEKLKSFESKFDNVKINMCNDYGPATKLLGLEEIKLNSSDIIIILDDDIKYKDFLTTYYALGYEIYNPDGIGIRESTYESLIETYMEKNLQNIFKLKYNEIYFESYNDNLYGWCSFSFRYNHIGKIINKCKEILNTDKLIWKHDDALFTYCYKKLNLKLIGMNLSQPDITILFYQNSLLMNNIMNLNYRKKLENKYIVPEYNPLVNNTYNDKYTIKIINKRIFIITIETKTPNIEKELYLTLNNKNIKLKINLPYHKQSMFYKTNFNLL